MLRYVGSVDARAGNWPRAALQQVPCRRGPEAGRMAVDRLSVGGVRSGAWLWRRSGRSRLRQWRRAARTGQGAATAGGHGRAPPGQEADRMGRIHRPVRAGAEGGRARPGLGLRAGDRLPGRAGGRGRPDAVRDRPAALSGDRRPPQGADRAVQGRARPGPAPAGPRAAARHHLGRRQGAARRAQCGTRLGRGRARRREAQLRQAELDLGLDPR